MHGYVSNKNHDIVRLASNEVAQLDGVSRFRLSDLGYNLGFVGSEIDEPKVLHW
jgi:hypothetical protein